MPLLETDRDGFTLSFKGRTLLRHSAASPCLHLSEGPSIEWLEREKGEGRWLRIPFRDSAPLREFRILENGDEGAILNFEGRLGLEIGSVGGALALTFRPQNPVGALRLDLPLEAGDAVFGGGADVESLVDLSHAQLEAWNDETTRAGLGALSRPRRGRDWPRMAFVSESHRWILVEGEGWMAADFRARGRASFEFSSAPRHVVLGVEADMASAVAALAKRTGAPSPAPPPWTREGPIVATGADERRLEGLLSRLAGAGIGAAGIRLLDFDLMDRRNEEDPRPAMLRSRGIRALAVARPGMEAARELDEGRGAAIFAAVERGLRSLSGLRFEPSRHFFAASSRPGAEGPDCRVARRSPLLARALLEQLDGAGSAAAEFLLSAAKGWAWDEASPACTLALDAAEPSAIPRRISALLAHGLSGGGWAWLDPSYAPCPSPARGAAALRAETALRRALELAAFGPVFEVCMPEDERDSDLRLLARMGAIFSALGPYHAAVAEELREKRLSPIRHALVHYEGGIEALRGASQYLYGRDLLVAVSVGTGDFVTLDLPDDDWIHLWSSRRFRGGPVSIEAPLGQPAVFYRASSDFAGLFDALRIESRRAQWS